MDGQHLLIVEDDAKIADMLRNYLEAAGYGVTLLANGLEAVSWVRQQTPALVVLDVMLPGLDGMAVCRQIRAFSQVPIIMATARVEEVDRLLGLDLGADDYLCKPFSPRELVARVKALLRRSSLTGVWPLSLGDGLFLAEASNQLECLVDGHKTAVALTAVEWRILKALAGRPGHIFSRQRLLEVLHDDFRDVSDRSVDTHIKNLRRKLDQGGGFGQRIASVYGAGYRYEAVQASAA